jgi:hypothetical protein
MEIGMCMTVNLPAVLYGSGTWSVTLSEEHSVRVFKDRVLRKTFGGEREKGTGDWRKLCKEVLPELY